VTWRGGSAWTAAWASSSATRSNPTSYIPDTCMHTYKHTLIIHTHTYITLRYVTLRYVTSHKSSFHRLGPYRGVDLGRPGNVEDLDVSFALELHPSRTVNDEECVF